MLARILERWRWRHSPAFEIAVTEAIDATVSIHGARALTEARRKAQRRHQSVRRKWVWRAAVKRLSAGYYGLRPE